jgi:hypothetical protein
MECDFCGQPVASKDDFTVVPVDRFEIPQLNYMNLSWGWGGCPECAVFLRRPKWEGLLDRAVAHHPQGLGIKVPLAWIYAELRNHQNGPLRDWLPEDDEDKET